LDTTLLASAAIGGVGLFLLGMRLMTDGLRVAAGRALQHLLERWTGSRLKGMLSGAMITAIVQSSSAVTVATIGFVNAGIIGLEQSIAVIYGSNVGTTMTGWIVAVFGFDVDIQAFALPAIGIGMALRLTGSGSRRGALGEALAGFGVFFLGIDVLRSAFGGLGATIQVAPYVREGFVSSPIFVGIGFMLTLLMQSSSAAMAITLTGAAGNVLPLGVAAAIVIGTNIGTTSTAALAAIGATPNAKRVALAHAVFNVVTGLVALAILPLMLRGVVSFQSALGLEKEPAVVLALFHTTFNLLGVLLMWPMTTRLTQFLKRRFRTVEEDESKPRFLDQNIAGEPVLALRALHRELERIGAIALRFARGSVSHDPGTLQRTESDHTAVVRLTDATGEFAVRLQESRMRPESAELLQQALLVARSYTEVADLAESLAEASRRSEAIEDPQLAEEVSLFKAAVIESLDADQSPAGAPASAALAAVESRYEELKALLVRSAAQGRLPVRQLAAHLDAISLMRRLARHAVDAGLRLRTLAGSAGADVVPDVVASDGNVPRAK